MDNSLTCKCGNPSVGRKLVCYYKKKDGTISEYTQIEKRCLKCINKSKTNGKHTINHKPAKFNQSGY